MSMQQSPSERRAIAAALLGVMSAGLIMWTSDAGAQVFPTKQMRVVVAFVPGGADDFHGRLVAQKLTEVIGQQVIVENRAGAGGLVGWDHVAKSPPDGHTLLLASPGLTVVRTLRPTVTLDPWRDFAWVSLVADYPLVLVTHPSVPAKNVKELIALARSQPGRLNYASSGIGATPHIAAEYFKSMAKVDITHVPYKGSAPAYIDIMGGQVAMYFAVPGSGIPHVRSGRLRGLGVTGLKRATLLPEVPTIAESALPGFDITSFWALLVPGGTPREIIQKLSGSINQALSMPDFRERAIRAGSEPGIMTPDEILEKAKNAATKFDRVIREANIKAE
jgi:tripartite-type tricarboxylate transporter receptor subunit TctC